MLGNVMVNHFERHLKATDIEVIPRELL